LPSPFQPKFIVTQVIDNRKLQIDRFFFAFIIVRRENATEAGDKLTPRFEPELSASWKRPKIASRAALARLFA
jgi:hypothetical protein